jgi:hypothetical protein
MFLKSASILGLLICGGLSFYGFGHMSDQSKGITGLAIPRLPAVMADAAPEAGPSETPNSRQAWIDPSGPGSVKQVARLTQGEVDQQAECRAKMVKAIKLHVLYSLEGESADRLKFVAGPVFDILSDDKKEHFVRAVHCAAQNGRGGQINIDLVHWKSRKVIGRFASDKLTSI